MWSSPASGGSYESESSDEDMECALRAGPEVGAEDLACALKNLSATMAER
jgi:hypothetical protein